MSCGEEPCLLKRYWGIIRLCLEEGRVPSVSECEEDNLDVVNTVEIDDEFQDILCRRSNEIRKAFYGMFVQLWLGYQGKGVRTPLPACVVQGVRSVFPDEDGAYMGYREK